MSLFVLFSDPVLHLCSVGIDKFNEFNFVYSFLLSISFFKMILCWIMKYLLLAKLFNSCNCWDEVLAFGLTLYFFKLLGWSTCFWHHLWVIAYTQYFMGNDESQRDISYISTYFFPQAWLNSLCAALSLLLSFCWFIRQAKNHGKQADISEFRAQLDALGLKIIQVTSDRNCFFRFVLSKIALFLHIGLLIRLV